MSHVFEFFTVSLAVFLLSHRLKRGEWRWMSEVVGSCAALIFLTRYNNAFLAVGLMASFLYLCFRESKKLPMAQAIRMAVPFLILVLIFRVLPVLVNGYSSFDQGYAGTLGRLLPEANLAFYWNRAGDILFGWDMGMLFTAPALLLGLAAMWRYRSNLPGEVMFLASLALLNIYFTMGWRSFGSFYGYRYICFTAMPLLAVPLVLMVDDLLQAVSKLRVWVMAAMLSWLPLMSMMAFERSEKFAFSLITNEYGVQTYSQPTYHLDLLQNLLLDPFATLSRAALTGVGAFFWAGLSPQQMGQRLLLYIGPPLLFCMLYLVRKSLFGTKPSAQSGRVTTPMKDAIFPVGEFFIGETHAEKYQSSNWIARRLVGNFMASILATVRTAGNQDVHEIGCGEGHILGLLAGKGFKVAGCDISDSSLAVAAREASRHGFVIPLAKQSIYELDSSRDAADTVLCCEVLEHLTDPEAGLRQLLAITRKDLIVSVPNEPVWHLLNILRGKYLTALGNTPGHFQHWSSREFVEFVGRHAEIVSVKKPLPWTLVHCRPRRKDEQ
jgi:2-polyprenyl-3-methyl-5-hydroxy-6-metoxy-1,4-benzoquinol methylase